MPLIISPIQRLHQNRAKLRDMDRELAARGAQQLVDLQDEESVLNASLADADNRKVVRYYQETGLDFTTSTRFLPAASLRFFVDFVIPIGTAVYAVVCMLRGR